MTFTLGELLIIAGCASCIGFAVGKLQLLFKEWRELNKKND